MNHRGSKTPLFYALRRLTFVASQKSESPFHNENILANLKEQGLVSRRDFLKTFGSTCAMAAIGGFPLVKRKPHNVKIVIIGAGIAGLNAAYKLKKAGIKAEIYEGSSRVGGRIFTGKDVMGAGLTTEFGGEFIDSSHHEMLTLAKEFSLEFEDRKSGSERSLIPRAYFFGGRHHTETEVIEAIKPFLEKIKADANSLPATFDFRHPGNAASFDSISLAEYFHRLEISGWIKDLLEAAYVSEFGLDLADQSALNFITLVSTDISDAFNIFGTSDERFIIKGGNCQITDQLSDRLRDQIHVSYKLEAIKNKGKGFTLTFQNTGVVKEINADIVLMAVPFSVLRDVEIKVELPVWKQKAIRELGYGTNTKVMNGFTKKIWREKGYLGEVFSDEHFQLAWDNSQFQKGEAGGLTSFSGGRQGLEAGSGTVDFQCDLFSRSIEKVFPGAAQLRNGMNQRFHWASYPFTKGSYSAYKPGQWATIHGAEAAPIGNLFFAGEHCSLEFQGFMNGAAETGKKAAEDILKLLD